MSNKYIQLNDTLYQYLTAVSLRESAILKELREETANHTLSAMQISPEQGQFMALLTQLMGAKKVLEIGVFTGYSSICVASALPEDGIITACDISDEYTAVARHYWQLAKLYNNIDLKLGPALNTLDVLINEGHSASYDLAFIDADKQNYDGYYEGSLKLLRSGGLVMIDNVLWGGRVANPTFEDADTQAIRALNKKIYADQRVSISLLPIADGLTLAIKR